MPLPFDVRDLQSERMIAAFRGLPIPRYIPRQNSVHDVSSMIDQIIEKYKIQAPKVEDTIRDNWGIIIGARFMNKCEPTKILSEDTLLIKVLNPIVRQELEFIKKQILENLQSIRGCEEIHRIAFR